jgi:hemolysin activation/secretion protein
VLTRLLASTVWFAALVSGLAAQNCTPPNQVPAPLRLLTFLNAELVSWEQRQAITQAIRDQRIDPKSLKTQVDSLADEFRERVKAVYQDQGYFRAEVTVRKQRTVADPEMFDLEAQVGSTGLQYRLGEITFSSAAAFPSAQLRNQFPLQRGEIFSRAQIAAGLNQLRRLYGSEGYLAYSAIPDSRFDDATSTANLAIAIAEGKQFHVRALDIGGADAETAARIRTQWDLAPGGIFRLQDPPSAVEKFAHAVADATPNLSYRRVDDEWVDVVLAFRRSGGCP